MAIPEGQPEVLYKHIMTDQAAEFLGISKRKLQSMEDGPDYIRLGRLIRYRLIDLIAFQEGKRRSSSDENQA